MSDVEEIRRKIDLAQKEITDLLAKHGFDGFVGYVGIKGQMATIWMGAPGYTNLFREMGNELNKLAGEENIICKEEGLYKPRSE